MDEQVEKLIWDITDSLKRRITVIGGEVSGPRIDRTVYDESVKWDIRFHVSDKSSIIYKHILARVFHVGLRELAFHKRPAPDYSSMWCRQIVQELMDAADQVLPPAPLPPPDHPPEMIPDDFYRA